MEAKDDSELVIGAKSVELRLLSACPPKIAWCHSAWHNSLFELSKPDGGQIEHVIDDTLDSDVILPSHQTLAKENHGSFPTLLSVEEDNRTKLSRLACA